MANPESYDPYDTYFFYDINSIYEREDESDSDSDSDNDNVPELINESEDG